MLHPASSDAVSPLASNRPPSTSESHSLGKRHMRASCSIYILLHISPPWPELSRPLPSSASLPPPASRLPLAASPASCRLACKFKWTSGLLSGLPTPGTVLRLPLAAFDPSARVYTRSPDAFSPPDFFLEEAVTSQTPRGCTIVTRCSFPRRLVTEPQLRKHASHLHLHRGPTTASHRAFHYLANGH